MAARKKFEATREFIDTLADIISKSDHSVLDKILQICRRLNGHYVPSDKFVLRHENIQRIVNLYHEGHAIDEIIEFTGLKKSTIYNILKKYNGERHKKKTVVKKANDSEEV